MNANCFACGTPLVGVHRAPKVGAHFCPDGDCPKAYEAARRSGCVLDPADGAAPDRCAGCEARLEPRTIQPGDKFGRFCSAPACQAADATKIEDWQV